MGCNSIDSKGTVPDAIRVSTYDRPVIDMCCLIIDEVLLAIVVPEDNVLRIAVLVIYEQICESCSIGYERRVNSRRRDRVFGERG